MKSWARSGTRRSSDEVIGSGLDDLSSQVIGSGLSPGRPVIEGNRDYISLFFFQLDPFMMCRGAIVTISHEDECRKKTLLLSKF